MNTVSSYYGKVYRINIIYIKNRKHNTIIIWNDKDCNNIVTIST